MWLPFTKLSHWTMQQFYIGINFFTETNLWLLQTINMNIRQLPDHMNTPHIDKMKISISTNYSRPNRRPCIDSESEDAIEWKNDRKWIITIDMITIYKDSHWIKQRFLFWIRFSPKRIFELLQAIEMNSTQVSDHMVSHTLINSQIRRSPCYMHRTQTYSYNLMRN